METLENIIELLKLKPHPEGGFYRETYRSEGIINDRCLGVEYSGSRNHSTCIYYLLNNDAFSSFHKIVQDEIWHYYDGSPVALQMITPLGYHIEVIIGRDFSKGQVPQYVIPGGTWFGAKPVEPNSYSLFGCTVAPGFTFADFKQGDREELIQLYPQYSALIMEYTR
jgi:predicted cupin superfamily sugar epimerase